MVVIFMLMFGAAWIWMIVIAFKNDQILWGVLMIIFTIPSFFYGIVHWDKASKPFILGIVAMALAVLFLDPEEVEKHRNTSIQQQNTEIERFV